MTYWNYWNFSRPPFAQTTSGYFAQGSCEEALARVDFLVANRRALGAVVGPSGVGKSRLLTQTADSSEIGSLENITLLRSTLLGWRNQEFANELATRLTGHRVPNSTAWDHLRDYFEGAARQGTQTVLLLDDAESASIETEAVLLRLLAMDLPLTVLLAIELEAIGAVNRTFLERAELQIELAGWELRQTGAFLAWACQQAGRAEPIFTDEAVRRIQSLSVGLVRKIISIADLALVAGAVGQLDYVDGDLIDQVAYELPHAKAA